MTKEGLRKRLLDGRESWHAILILKFMYPEEREGRERKEGMDHKEGAQKGMKVKMETATHLHMST